jgi:hypothetical protein
MDERVDPAREPFPALVGEEIDGDGLDGAFVDFELAMWITTRRAQEEPASQSAVQLLVGQVDPLARDEGEHGQRISELAGIYTRKQLV